MPHLLHLPPERLLGFLRLLKRLHRGNERAAANREVKP